jgi:hypothetical protein
MGRPAEDRDHVDALARGVGADACVTWMHSSRVGVRTSAWTSGSVGSTYSMIGRPNAAVFPDPVWACR